MMGTEVLKISPNKTESPAASPAVRARSFCDEISPTKAQPSEPRAELNRAQTQATKMRDSNDGTRYECEIELVNPGDYMAKHNDEHATLSTLQKIFTTLPEGCTAS